MDVLTWRCNNSKEIEQASGLKCKVVRGSMLVIECKSVLYPVYPYQDIFIHDGGVHVLPSLESFFNI